jgi:hypothetical protein
VANHTNIVNNLYEAGPSSLAGYTPIQLGQTTPAFPSGSQVFISGNRKHGAAVFASGNTSEPQSLMYSANATLPSGFYQAGKIASAWPTGYNENIIIDTDAGHLEFATLLNATAGFRPLDRAAGWDSFSGNHASNYINGLTGVTNVGRLIDGLSTYGNGPTVYGAYPPSITSNLIDPYSSADMSGHPCPTVEGGRDTIQASGLTLGEEWLQYHHFRRAPY